MSKLYCCKKNDRYFLFACFVQVFFVQCSEKQEKWRITEKALMWSRKVLNADSFLLHLYNNKRFAKEKLI